MAIICTLLFYSCFLSHSYLRSTGLLTVCFGATGTLFSIAKRATNDGKVSAPE